MFGTARRAERERLDGFGKRKLLAQKGARL